MPEPISTSTLELVVNEQQFPNMTQIDLGRSNLSGMSQQTASATSINSQVDGEGFSFKQVRGWPARFRESFQSKMDEAKANSETSTEFVIQLVRAFSGTLIWTLCFVGTIIIPLVLFIAGILNLDNCPARPSLPYLVFAIGFTMTASNLFNLALALQIPILSNHQTLTIETKNIIASIINIIFNCVVAFLYILCGHKVFSLGASRKSSDVPTDDQDDPEWECNPFLYHLTFWFISLTLIMFLLLTLVASIFFAYNKYRMAIIRGSTPRNQDVINR